MFECGEIRPALLHLEYEEEKIYGGRQFLPAESWVSLPYYVMNIEKKVRATVGAVIEKDGKVLLVKRNHEPFKDYWCLPGGHIDFGETAEQAVIREVKEETGLTFTPKFLGYRDEIYPDINWHAEVLVFYGEVQDKEAIDGKEIIDIRWFDINEALNMKLAFEHEKTLKIYIKKK